MIRGLPPATVMFWLCIRCGKIKTIKNEHTQILSKNVLISVCTHFDSIKHNKMRSSEFGIN